MNYYFCRLAHVEIVSRNSEQGRQTTNTNTTNNIDYTNTTQTEIYSQTDYYFVILSSKTYVLEDSQFD